MAVVVSQRLSEFLRAAGASAADIEQAEDNGWLPVLALDRLLMPGAPVHDLDSLAEHSGVEGDRLARIWRALGFPDVPAGLELFSEQDLEAVRRLAGTATGAVGGLRRALGESETPARIISAALSRIAAYEVELFAAGLDDLRNAGLDDDAAALAMLDDFEWDDLAWFIDYIHRLQLRAAAWRRLTTSTASGGLELGVGFVDLSGYTELSEELDDRGLAELLDQFEVVVGDTVAQLGGRVVKTRGDEIMFVGPGDAVASIALTILDRAHGIEELPSVRIGVSFGPVLARGGDYFGPVVNLASRITDRARPGSILAAEAVHDLLDGDARFSFRPLAPRRIRGIGPVRLFALRGPRRTEAIEPSHSG